MNDARRGRVMLRRQLLEEGYNDKAIARLVQDGTWVKLRHGAYTEAHTWGALDHANRHALVTRAVVAQARTPVVVSHTSGLPFYDAPTWGIDLSQVHVTREDHKAGRQEAGVQQHSGVILPDDACRRDDLPVMAATRLGLEVTTVADAEASLCVVSHLLHERHTTPEALAARYQQHMQQWPHTLSTDLVLRLADPRFESVGECRTYYLCFRQGLPMPEPQYEIKDDNGRVVARVDFAWPELGVFLEFDGMVKYEKLLRDGESASDVVVREKRRQDLICRLTGWQCIRIVWADLFDPARTAALIRSVLFPADRAA
ncbi:type IV toxin-antitoxin system AbiEi family antitoxin domain-containing protein [Nocardioides sp. YIM 152315]|uniref:type IV toxin-antitoxin system AbiEi family antitoxin domain-containing protein n=1 Tax=Nocardioides sp. YIM 152315 TaxID=3031760 RepID=UPI0023DB5666|nr:type IV toxin-antitoxin system AbiEi family antitoxin domain-containing protein [Nocardioides sp. YIM 152315]MDF1603473.1 type IV toxin-antitoxin system AbiEi family antitoxin domain-containing protein [Nocardioides sp. YIM 152315]